jgi:hypothetical protein
MRIKNIAPVLFLIFISCGSQSQNDIKTKTIYIADVTSEFLAGYSITPDTLRASISIYFNGFESAEKRQLMKTKLKTEHIEKNGQISPSFQVNFSSSFKPTKVKSIEDIAYITAEEFSKTYYKSADPRTIIIKQNDGTFLIWKVIAIRPE